MFTKNESVVVKRNSGSTHSGRVVKQIDDDHYRVAYIHNGSVLFGEFHNSRITSFNGEMFMVIE